MLSTSPQRRSITIFSPNKKLKANVSPRRSFVSDSTKNLINGSLGNHLYATKILNDLTLSGLVEQDKLVEIERLKTTCVAL
jgi:hypothetical protein